MFGLGLFAAYGQYVIAGVNASFLVAIFTRVAVGIGWYQLFDRAGKNPIFAFIPLLGPYTAFRMVWDDFSMSAIFASTTFIAFVDAMGVEYGIIKGFAILNFILWWFMCLLTCNRFNLNMILGFLAGGIPWIGVPLQGFWPTGGSYHGPWSTDPEADQNLSSQERKKRRRKAEREEKAAKGKKK